MFAPTTTRPDLAGVWSARQAWRSESALSAGGWLAAHTSMTRSSAARLCATARLVHHDYGPIGRATVERLACDARVARVVMAGRSRVLDLGSLTPVISPALRKAVKIRDRHCQHPGCRAPAKWCDAHHIVHWTKGGRTDLDDLVLLCRRHHVQHHEGGWQLSRAADGTIVATPSMTQPFARRRPRSARA